MSKIKNKIASVFQPSRGQNNSEPRLKRCLNGFSEAELTIESRNVDLNSLSIEQLREFLKNLLSCLEKEKTQNISTEHKDHDRKEILKAVTEGISFTSLSFNAKKIFFFKSHMNDPRRTRIPLFLLKLTRKRTISLDISLNRSILFKILARLITDRLIWKKYNRSSTK